MAAMENDFENTTISLFGTVPDSIVDGPGLRYAVFVQGCSHHCPGCHNPESQPAEGGTETTLAALLADIRANGLVHDVTLSGGEPFEQPEACAALAAGVLNYLTDRQVTVKLKGGELLAEWREDTDEILLTGPAVHVFDGEV